MATKTKKTPAYVEKAIKWLEKNAPDNEQIAFISDEEAALLKARGGSGKEVVHGVRSYQGVDLDQEIREARAREETQANQDFLAELRRRAEGVDVTPLPEIVPPYSPPGGAGELQRALGEIDTLQQPATPQAPTLQTAPFQVAGDQLIDQTGLGLPTVDYDPAREAQIDDISTTVPSRVPAATTTAVQAGDTSQAAAAQLAAPTRTIEDIQGATPTEELAQAATADLDPRATVQFQLGEITSSIRDGEPLPLWAAPAARNADSLMLRRGLGASSMAASARTQALIEAGLPIASADAQSYGRIQLQNLTHKQATALQNANTLAAMRTQNLNNRMTAAVNNAQNFLAIDTANLSNRQTANTLSYNAFTQKLFSDQAAENAASQFNATSTNQVEQYFSTLENAADQANKNRLSAMRQFNIGEKNAYNEFIINQQLSRDSFNSTQAASIRAANANWYRSVSTIDNANQMQSNAFAAQSTLQIRNNEYQALLQRRRDDAHFIFEAFEREEDRKGAVAIAAQNAGIARSNQSAALKRSIFDTVTNVVARIIMGS